MISTQMMKLAEANVWKVNNKEEMIFGEYNGYLFSVLEGKRFKAFITPIAGISPMALEQIVQYLDDHFKSLKLRNYDISDNFLCVRIEEGLFPLSMEKMELMLGHLSGLLDLYEAPDKACVVCGEPAQRRGLYLGLFCHLHKECEQKDMIDFTAGHGSRDQAADETTAAANDEQPAAEPSPEQASAETEKQPENPA